MTTTISQKAVLCTPRDWELEHRSKALSSLFSFEAAAHNLEADRYAFCAAVIEAQANKIAQLQSELMAAHAEIAESAPTSSCLDGASLIK